MTIYKTLKKTNSTDESHAIAMCIEDIYHGKPYFIRNTNVFNYSYNNEANSIHKILVGYQVFVEYMYKGTKYLDLIILRFLESPIYEIEKQIEEFTKVNGKEDIENKDNNIINKEEKVIKHRRGKKDIYNSFQRAKMIAEKNASFPDSMSNEDFMEKTPYIIPIDPDDNIKKNMSKKYEKEKENSIADAIERNKRKMMELKSEID